jgi:peptidoglycan/xylan/chitin deacetylase (PgdA/CDA1 family)
MKCKVLFGFVISFSLLMSTFMRCTSKIVSKEGFKIPVLMYHFFTKNSSKTGKYTINNTKLEEDLKYIKDNYVTITSKDLVMYMYEGKSLASNSIVITVDDSSLSFYTIMYPLLKKYNLKVILNVIGKYSDDNNGFHMSWNQIKEVEASGLVELGSHSYNLHEQTSNKYGMKRYKGESDESYIKRIKEDLMINNEKLESLNGIKPITFTYPLGYFNDILKKVIKEIGFLTSYSCKETLYNIDDLYNIPRFNRDGNLSTHDMFSKIYS